MFSRFAGNRTPPERMLQHFELIRGDFHQKAARVNARFWSLQEKTLLAEQPEAPLLEPRRLATESNQI
jgi:hypothetical protein